MHRSSYISHSALSGREPNDLSIFKKGLTPEEVQILYNNTGIAPPAPAPNPQEVLAAKRGGYRYGFNGKEKDDEVKGSGNSYDYGARMYDNRLGRWLSVDPLSLKYPFASTYQYALNSPLQFMDPDGKRVRPINENSAEILRSYLESAVGENKQLANIFGNMQRTKIGTVDNVAIYGFDVSNFPKRSDFTKLLKDDSNMSTDQKLAMLAWFDALTDDEILIEVAIFDGNGGELNANSGDGISSTKPGDEGIPLSNSFEFMDYSADVRTISGNGNLSEAEI